MSLLEKPPTPEEDRLPVEPEEELVPEDDRVIGQAFRWSLLVLAALLLLGGGAWLLLRPRATTRPDAAITTAPPVANRPVGEPPAVVFRDVTAEAGIGFVHFNGATGSKLLPETMGGGGAFFDLDRDGDQDLLLVNGTSWPDARRGAGRRSPTVALYRNLGGFRFADVSASHGPGLDFYGMGVAVGDYDGDGWTDALITAVGRNHLLRNAEGRLVDVTERAGVAGDPGQWTTGAAFLDYDRDGDLDLFVCNYVKWTPHIDLDLDYQLTGVGRAYGPPLNYEGTYPFLYRNDGDGTFTDVSAQSGVRIDNPATDLPVAKSLAVLPIDADGDGWVDLMVANDTVRNFFFRNRGDGTFEEAAEAYGLAYDRDGNARGAMGVDAGSYRNDDELGFVIGNFANEMSALYVSQGDPTLYVDEAIAEGIGAATRTRLSFGVLFLDYDLDGRLDLLQSNGHLEEEIGRVDPSQTYRQPAQLFWNAGPEAERTFALVPPERSGDLDKPHVGRGSAVADVEGDGDLDVLLLQVGGAPMLLRNEQQLGHHWLRVKLVGEGGNREALGARVELRAGGTVQRRQVTPTRSYLSQSELPITFGLGKTTSVESLRVTWPDGSEQQVPVPGVDRLLVVEKKPA
jgi:enediyne biosynthesis protein E4